MAEKIGIFGGTFNPPHVGHLILAETSADALGLDRIYFVTAAQPAHKMGVPLALAEDRLAMVKLAIAGNSRLEASRVDMDRPGPHFTVDMLRIFREQSSEAEFYFLMGSDSLRDLMAWSRPLEIIKMVQLVVMQRPDMYPDLAMLTRNLPGLLERVYFLDAPEIEISSRDIVARLKAGLSVRYRVPDAVLQYIQEHGLYTDEKDT